jgi:Icc-related predicted phosphoesterase
MNIAIFADVHGRILLAFKVVERYQRETGEKIDLILQCGDMGIFPDPSRLDKATIRHAEVDETELGFSRHFVVPNDEAERVLSQVDCNLLCVRGNHEDHAFLDQLELQSNESAFSADCYERIHLLKTGVPHVEEIGGARLRVVGIGRIGAPVGETETTQDKYIQPFEQERIVRLGDQRLDIVVTHDARRGMIRPGIGMEEINTVLEKNKPVYHFFGHTGEAFRRRIDKNGVTVASKLSDFEWDEVASGHRLKSDCFGMLRWRGIGDHEFDVIEAPWLKEYTRYTWNHL